MPAGTYNLTIEQGADFAIKLTLSEDGNAKDLTNYEARGQMRQKKTSEAVSGTFDCNILEPTEGTLRITMSNEVTQNLVAGIYYYDIELYTLNDGNVSRLLEGQATVTQEVTR